MGGTFDNKFIAADAIILIGENIWCKEFYKPRLSWEWKSKFGKNQFKTNNIIHELIEQMIMAPLCQVIALMLTLSDVVICLSWHSKDAETSPLTPIPSSFPMTRRVKFRKSSSVFYNKSMVWSWYSKHYSFIKLLRVKHFKVIDNTIESFLLNLAFQIRSNHFLPNVKML